jgi:hypothetical protein
VSVTTNLLSANVSGVETDASGWTAGANTTLSQSTRFYLGAKSLGLTATASGTVTATTATRVAVVAGQEYQAYGFFANVVAAASRTSAVTISWYTASSGGSPISTASGTATTLANSTAWNTPPPQVTATAPVGAAYASVTITVTGMAAGAMVAADVMTLGAPTTWPGNLLKYNAASAETDAAGWAALANCTVDRVQPDCWEGWYSLRLTSTAAGVCRANSFTPVPVIEGSEYVGMTMVKPGTTGDFLIELRWYDAGDSFLSGSGVTWSALPSGSWTKVTAIGTAPPGAATARLALRPTATASGQTWLCDQMGLTVAPRIAGSILPYAVQSTEIDASGWSVVAGCAVSRSTFIAVQGAASLLISPTGGGQDATAQMTAAVPVTPGQAYRAAFWIYHETSAHDINLDVIFTWYDAGGAEIAVGTYRWIMASAAGWYTPVGSDVAPDEAASLRVSIRILSPTGLDFYYVDEISLGPGGLGVAARVIPSAYGAEINIQGLTTGGHTHYGLWRMREDGALTPVRGESGDMSALPITGDLSVAADYEAPLGVAVRYFVKAFTEATYLRATSRVVTLPEPAPTDIVLKDPTQPVRQATLTVVTLPDWTRSARQGVHQISGRARPIVITDVRTSRTGTLTVVTATHDEIQRLWWLVEQGSTLLVQWPSTWGESDTYVQVGDVSESHVVQWADYADRAWTLALTEVDRPVGGITGSAVRTWEDVGTESLDWLHVLMTYASWVDVYTGEVGA